MYTCVHLLLRILTSFPRSHCRIEISEMMKMTQKWLSSATNGIDSEDAKLVEQVRLTASGSLRKSRIHTRLTMLCMVLPISMFVSMGEETATTWCHMSCVAFLIFHPSLCSKVCDTKARFTQTCSTKAHSKCPKVLSSFHQILFQLSLFHPSLFPQSLFPPSLFPQSLFPKACSPQACSPQACSPKACSPKPVPPKPVPPNSGIPDVRYLAEFRYQTSAI